MIKYLTLIKNFNFNKTFIFLNLFNFIIKMSVLKEPTFTLKIVVAGLSGVGKTTLLTRYVKNEFDDK